VEDAVRAVDEQHWYHDVELKSQPSGRVMLEASPDEARRYVHAAAVQAAYWDEQASVVRAQTSSHAERVKQVGEQAAKACPGPDEHFHDRADVSLVRDFGDAARCWDIPRGGIGLMPMPAGPVRLSCRPTRKSSATVVFPAPDSPTTNPQVPSACVCQPSWIRCMTFEASVKPLVSARKLPSWVRRS